MNEITNKGSESLEELLGFLGSEVFQIEIKEPEIKDYPLDTNFLVGLIEGDGSFHISFKAKRDLDFGFSYHSTYFFITPTQKGSTATGLR